MNDHTDNPGRADNPGHTHDGPTPVARVQGEATLRCLPDLADIQVAVRVLRGSHDEVRRELGEQAERIRQLIADNADGVLRDDGGTVWVSPRYDKSGRRVIGAQGTFTMSITFSDFTVMQQVVNQLFGVQDVLINGPFWSLRHDNPAHRDARLAAIEEGRRRAADYASAFGARVTGLIEVSDGHLDHSGGFTRGRAYAASASGPGENEPTLNLEPEEQEVQASVSMVFALSQGHFDAR